MGGDITPYIDRVTSEHINATRFIETLSASVQPFADSIDVLNGLYEDFDLDNAIGAQLDILGQWIGISRYVTSPLTGVYFSFDTSGLGFDQGYIFGPGDSTSGLSALPDDIYVILLKAKIIANYWDGTANGAYAAWNALLGPYGYQILIQDNGNMTMTYALFFTGILTNYVLNFENADSSFERLMFEYLDSTTGQILFQTVTGAPDPIMLQLFISGVLNLKPAGIGIDGYVTPTMTAPFFGFDVEGPYIAGFDVGAFGLYN
jgi:hypothetical protein